MFAGFKITMATMVKSMKDKSVVPELMKELVAAIHIDNLEQYQCYAINPSKSLHHSMVIGVQQPKTGDEDVDKTEPVILLEPRKKRPSLDYQQKHINIPVYMRPDSAVTEKEKRLCNKEDFLYDSEKDTKIISEFELEMLTHTFLRIEGVTEEGQMVPNLKEVLSWGAEEASATNSVYLELIPEKADNKDTVLYTLNIIEELFIKKLKYEHIIVCGDGLTVNILYQIKDEYGKSMDWLVVMLGSWHTLKDYLGVVLKRYRHAFLHKTLQTCFSGNTLEGIFNVSQWDRSHMYAMCVHEALLRHFLKALISSELISENLASELKSTFKNAVFSVLAKDSITKEDAMAFHNAFTACMNTVRIIHQTHICKFKVNSIKDDEIFHLFQNFMDDFLPYYMMYIAIRSGNWSMRQTSLKMMAERFVVSGATLYQWLSLRHLADTQYTYPLDVIEFYEKGGWVSALRDSSMATLARDEFHERTASKDIQFYMPRNQTKKNMEVVCHYLTIGAKLRKTLLEEILGKSTKPSFFSKGCGAKYKNQQESFVKSFFEKLDEVRPFSAEGRELRKPFTEEEVKDNIRNDMLNSKQIGHDMLLAYVLPRFCNQKHDIPSEKRPMKRKVIATFPANSKGKRKKKNVDKEQKNMLELLAAGVTRMSVDDVARETMQDIAGSPVNRYPQLFSDSDGQLVWKEDKTGVRKFLERRYEEAFTSFLNEDSFEAVIKDSLQDITTQPRSSDCTFFDYFES